MADLRPSSQLWLSRLAFVIAALVLMFLRLMPLGNLPSQWAGPDILLAATLAWVVRRPSAAPVLSIALVFLLADLLFQRPPGLMAGLVVVATEALRRRWQMFRSAPLGLEWLWIAMTVLGIMISYRLFIALAMLPQVSLLPALSEMAATILVYPLVIAVMIPLFGLRRRAPGEVDTLGHRV